MSYVVKDGHGHRLWIFIIVKVIFIKVSIANLSENTGSSGGVRGISHILTMLGTPRHE